jgi:hypothetical protein
MSVLFWYGTKQATTNNWAGVLHQFLVCFGGGDCIYSGEAKKKKIIYDPLEFCNHNQSQY